MGLLPFRCLFRELAPLERSHGQQGASSSGVREFGQPVALRRFAQAIFTGFHLPPKLIWAMASCEETISTPRTLDRATGKRLFPIEQVEKIFRGCHVDRPATGRPGRVPSGRALPGSGTPRASSS